MITQVLHCPYGQGTDIVRHGTSSEGKQRYRCRECRLGCGRTFLLDEGVSQLLISCSIALLHFYQ